MSGRPSEGVGTEEEEVQESVEKEGTIKKPAGFGRTFDTRQASSQEPEMEASSPPSERVSEEFEAEREVAQAQGLVQGIRVIDTDGSAIHRITFEYLRQNDPQATQAYNEDYQSIDSDVAKVDKEISEVEEVRERKVLEIRAQYHEQIKTIGVTAAEGEEPKELTEEEKEKIAVLEAKRDAEIAALEEEHKKHIAELQKEREGYEAERGTLLENYFEANPPALSEQQRDELHKHIEAELLKDYPDDLRPSKKGDLSVYSNDSGELHCKERSDGKVELSAGEGAFSGVVRVPRIGSPDDVDIVEYKDGVPIAVVEGRRGQSAIHNFDQLLGEARENGITVMGREEDSLRRGEAPKKVEDVSHPVNEPPHEENSPQPQHQPPKEDPHEEVQPQPQAATSVPAQIHPTQHTGDPNVEVRRIVEAATKKPEAGSLVPGAVTAPHTPGHHEKQAKGAGIGQ